MSNPVQQAKYKYSVHPDGIRLHHSVNPNTTPHVGMMASPNANGALHLGHTMVALSEDVWARLNQLRGKDSRLITGADHGGHSLIMVAKKECKSSQYTLLEKCNFVFNHYKPMIFETLDNLRTQFGLEEQRSTIDPKHRDIVVDTFVDLVERGFITRTRVPVNWCPLCETIVPRVEAKPSFSRVHRYLLRLQTEAGEEVHIFSEEPEMLKGHPFAVLPDNVSIKRLLHPLKKGEFIRVVKESEASNLKPGFLYWPESNLEAYQIAKRNNWPTITTRLYSLRERLEARDEVVEELILTNSYVQTEAENVRVFRCHCNTKLEMLPLEQWVLDLAKVRRDLNVQFDMSKVVPVSAREEWESKLDNYIGDWTLSRQNEWGIRPPAYYCKSCGRWQVAREQPKECAECQGDLEQDRDVLDVWFISNVGKVTWGKDSRRERENAILSSISLGSDTFGLAMIRSELLSFLMTGRSLAERVVVLPILVDEWGRKLSKSLGNAQATQEYLNKWGADILRLALLRARPWKGKVQIGEHLFIKSRNFLQKLMSIKDFILISENQVNKTARATEMDHTLLFSLARELSRADATIYEAVKQANFYVAVDKLEEVTRKVFSNVMVPYLRWRREQEKLSEEVLNEFRNLYLSWVNILWAFIPDAALLLLEELYKDQNKSSTQQRLNADTVELDFRVINQVLNASRKKRKFTVTSNWDENYCQLNEFVKYMMWK